MITSLKRLALIGIAILIPASTTTSTLYALSPYYMAEQNIQVFDPRAGEACRVETGPISTGGNTAYDGTSQVWSDPDMALIKQYQPLYERGTEKSGVPWQLIAVIHKMESSLTRVNPDSSGVNPTRPAQGLFGDYEGRMTRSEAIGTMYEIGKDTTDDEFVQQIEIAADAAIRKIEQKPFYGTITFTANDLKQGSTDAIKQLLFAYNGQSSRYRDKALALGFTENQAFEGSPYVMNRADARRDPTNPGGMDPAWRGLFVGDGVYDPSATQGNRFGSFVLYSVLAGVVSGSCGRGSIGSVASGNIAALAVELAWPQPVPNGTDLFTDATPAYQEVFREIFPSEVSGTASGLYNGKTLVSACDRFATAVMRKSGADPQFPSGGVTSIRDAVKANPDKYDVEENPNKLDFIPGDIIASTGHIMIYTGEKGETADGQKLVAADASLGDRIPSMRTTSNLDSMLSKGNIVRIRLK